MLIGRDYMQLRKKNILLKYNSPNHQSMKNFKTYKCRAKMITKMPLKD